MNEKYTPVIIVIYLPVFTSASRLKNGNERKLILGNIRDKRNVIIIS